MATRAAALLIALALVAGCARPDGEPRIPLPGQVASVESDRERGYAFDEEAQKNLPLIEDLVVLEFVDDLGARLVRSLGDQPFDYRFRVIVNPELNAFAVPGGYVYIHSGTLLSAGSVDELAGVMAHELGHVKGRHSARMAADTAIPSLLANIAGIAASAAAGNAAPLVAAQAANVAIQLQYSRQYEDEADRMAVNFLNHAGFGPEGLVRFFERIDLEERKLPPGQIPPYLYSHPQVESRIDVVRGLEEKTAPTGPPPRDLEARFAEVQARLSWLIEHRRVSLSAVDPFDRSIADPALARAAELRTAGRPDEALAVLNEAEGASPNDPRIAYRRGEILDEQGRLDDAIAAYRRAVHLDPNPSAVFLALGRAHEAAGHRREALFFLEQARFHAGPKGRVRTQIEGEIERLIFPVVTDSGFAVGEDARDEKRAIGEKATAVPAGTRRVAWWGQLGRHWSGRNPYFRVRWVAPDGTKGKSESPDIHRGNLIARHDFGRGGAAAGPWRLELLYGDAVVHSESIAAGASRG